jgi:hypothetical protein
MAMCVVLVAKFVGGSRSQSVYRARRIFTYSLSSMQHLAIVSQMATGYEHPAVLKLYGYINAVATWDTTDVLPTECWPDTEGAAGGAGPFFMHNLTMVGVLAVFAFWLWLCLTPQKLRCCCCCCCCCCSFCCPSHGNYYRAKIIHVSYKFQRVLLSTLLFFYAVACRFALRSVVCARVSVFARAESGEGWEEILVLRWKPSVECFGEAHFATGVLGYVTLVCFCAGFPAYLFFLVCRSNMFDHSQRRKKKQAVQSDGGGSASVQSDGGGSASADDPATTVTASHHVVAHSERRIEKNGGAFTKAEFETYYGGTTEWDAAEVAQTDHDCQSERRIDESGGAFTKAEFETHYRGTTEWGAAEVAQTAPIKKEFLNPASHSAAIYAFVRERKDILVAFTPLIKSDYDIPYLGVRPAYLCLLFMMSIGQAVFPPSSSIYAAHRVFVSLALIILYIAFVAWLRPYRRDRVWVFAVQLCVMWSSVLILCLAGYVELIYDIEEDEDAQGVVEVLSSVVVVCVVVVVAIVMPMATVYELVRGAKRDLRVNRLKARLKARMLARRMKMNNENENPGLQPTLPITNMLHDIGAGDDAVEFGELRHSISMNLAMWHARAREGAGRRGGDGNEAAAKEVEMAVR